MVDLAALANLGEAISGVAVLGGVGFGLYELRRARHARDQAAVQASMDLLQRPEILADLRLLLTLPLDADPLVIEQDPDMAKAAAEVGTAFVTFGMHLFSGAASRHASHQANPWLVYQVWARIHRWIRGSRHFIGPSNFWTFEWLVGQFQKSGVIPAEPAADPEPYRPGDGMDAWNG